MVTLRTIFLVAVAVVSHTKAQEPFPGYNSMMSGMQNMVTRLQNMGTNLARQGQEFGERMTRRGQELADRLAAQGERLRALNQRRTEWIKRFGPGETTLNSDGGTAHIYNSPDGTFSSVVYKNGNTRSNGYIFYSGPNGIWERRW